MSRPSTQHRLSVGAGHPAASLPVRSSVSRTHSHSVSTGSVNRISRRKSSTFSMAVENALADGSASVKRRSSATKAALAALNDAAAAYPAMPGSLPYHSSSSSVLEHHPSSSSAVIDGPSLSTFQGIDKSRAKMRRASDGTRLTKKEKAAAGDLKCEHCGKAYKHGSCLNKHLWEHTPQWQVTSKLLISKHQQVQLLEAASVLVQMNVDGPVAGDSDNSSSPAASGSSDREDEYSSTETTPPPHVDGAYRDIKRHSDNSSAYSRSYQSAISESAPHAEHGFTHYRQWSTSSLNRPATAATSIAESYRDEDPQDLAAAVGLLSCSYGTPKTGPQGMPADVPPVPPLPAKYAHPFSPSHPQDVVMDDDDDDNDISDDDDTDHPRSVRTVHAHTVHRPQQQPDDDEGMFGKMDA